MERYDGVGSTQVINIGSLVDRPNGWIHVDVTRDIDGRWILYINETIMMKVKDNTHPSFKYFGLNMMPSQVYDNFVVSDTIYVPQGSLRVSVKDSGGNALSGAVVFSIKQPVGQLAISGTSATDGSVTITGLAVGNYAIRVSKSGYVSGSVEGTVKMGAQAELSATLQAQPSSGGIPGFPYEAMIIGVLLCIIWVFPKATTSSTQLLWLNLHRLIRALLC